MRVSIPAVAPQRRPLAPALIALATVIALYPVLRNGFLVITFDDGAFILDNPYLRGFTWENAWACLSRFYFHDYLPVPMFAYFLQFQLWGTSAVGYHLVNLLVHIGNALLVYGVARCALGKPRAAACAALIFAVHPVQLEVVSVVAQLKTLLATGFMLGALIAYQQRRRDFDRWYAAALLLYVVACASKTSVVPFPFLLLFYDYMFRREPMRLADKLPFLAIAIVFVWIGMIPKSGVGVVKTSPGGSHLATVLVMSRVMWEYLDAMVLPLNLSPSYYYSPRALFALLNWLAVMAWGFTLIGLVRWRRRFPMTFFCAGWITVSLLPVANIIPIAVLRADRYLYLPMVAFSMWAASGLERLPRSVPARLQTAAWVTPYVLVVMLGALSWQYAAVWRSDVTAWTRVVQCHPWNSRAHYLLALAYAQRGAWEPARRFATLASTIDPTFDRPHALLADVLRRLGDDEAARVQEQQASALAPSGAAPAVAADGAD